VILFEGAKDTKILIIEVSRQVASLLDIGVIQHIIATLPGTTF